MAAGKKYGKYSSIKCHFVGFATVEWQLLENLTVHVHPPTCNSYNVINNSEYILILSLSSETWVRFPQPTSRNISNMQLSYVFERAWMEIPSKVILNTQNSYKNCHSKFWHLLAELSEPCDPPVPLSTCVICVWNSKLDCANIGN